MQSDINLRLGLIYGSVRPGRFCDTVADWSAREIDSYGGFTLDRIDPKHLGLTGWQDDEQQTARLRRQIDQADGFIVVTPEYNHGYPAVLKALIDSAYDEWQAKPVGFVSYGGAAGGLRAVEQLRRVFAELHTVTLRDSVSIAHPWDRFGADGRLHDGGVARQTLHTLLAHLNWWTAALRSARDISPYRQIAA